MFLQPFQYYFAYMGLMMCIGVCILYSLVFMDHPYTPCNCKIITKYFPCPFYTYHLAESTHSVNPYLTLTLVLLNPDIPCLCKQCRSRSVGFFRSQLIWICTVCHSVCEFISTIWIKQSDWLTIRSGRGILIYSA